MYARTYEQRDMPRPAIPNLGVIQQPLHDQAERADRSNWDLQLPDIITGVRQWQATDGQVAHPSGDCDTGEEWAMFPL
jgi:hypothetical protein